MVATKTPIVSLQAPKDVSLEEIDRELNSLWASLSKDEDSSASRAATFSLIVYEPNATQELLAALGYYTGPVDGIAGPRNQAAISAAQKSYGLEVTGETSPQLLERLQAEYDRAKAEGKLTAENRTVAIQHNGIDSQSAIADSIASANPCRIIALVPSLGQDDGVTAQVSAYCPVNKKNQESLICCEYITLSGTAEALERISGIILNLTIGDLPKFVWWKAAPAPEYSLFQRLLKDSDSMIFDSSSFSEPEINLSVIQQTIQQGTTIADLNWRRLAPWQELSAEAFDPPERRAEIYKVDKVTIDYEKGNTAQAMMFLGWLASRLNWTPKSYQQEGGDYDLCHVQFISNEGKEISAELAAIPTADWGEIPGDLISLRLTSTDDNADCCTVLCSSTTGCMRMETGGGAQSCYIQQVAPLFDQKTEDLLGQQLQRWGREVLYEESMAVTAKILELNS